MTVFRLFILFMCAIGAFFVESRSFDELHVAGSCEVNVVYNPDSVGVLVAIDNAENVTYSYGATSLYISVPSVPGSRELRKFTIYADSNLRIVDVSGRAKVNISEVRSTESLAFVASGAASLLLGHVSAPNINVSLSGSGSITITDELTATNLNFSVSGSGKIKADAVTTTRMSVTHRGSGKLVFAGSARDCAVVERGSGSIDLQKLVSDKLDLKLFGDGHIFYSAGIPVKLSGNTDNIIQVKPYQPL